MKEKYQDVQYCKDIEIQHGDLLKTDWSEADILYVSSVCFSEEMLEGIDEMSNEWKIGTRMILLRLLPANPKWKNLRTFRYAFSNPYQFIELRCHGAFQKYIFLKK